MHKTVKVAYGKTVTVRFTQPINQSEIDRLQTWQEGHDYQDGGTYGAKITRHIRQRALALPVPGRPQFAAAVGGED
jgi:hypothetical protein